LKGGINIDKPNGFVKSNKAVLGALRCRDCAKARSREQGAGSREQGAGSREQGKIYSRVIGIKC